MKELLPLAALAFAGTLHAHEGHGLVGSHWHASDAWGFAVVAGLIGLAIWLRRK